MRKIINALLVPLLLSACVTAAPVAKNQKVEVRKLGQSEWQSVQNAVRNNMKDSESARFGEYVAFKATDTDGVTIDIVCGYVNGKNSYGGYVGMTPYIATGLKGRYTANGPGEFYMRVCKSNYGISI